MFGANAFGWAYFGQAYAGTTGAVQTITASVSGGATISASVVRVRSRTAAVNGRATITASVVRTRARPASVTGTATVTAAVVRTRARSATVSGRATITAFVVRIRARPAAVTGSATITASVSTGATTGGIGGGGGLMRYLQHGARLRLPDCDPGDEECLRLRRLLEQAQEPEPIVTVIDAALEESLRRQRQLRLQAQQDERELEELLMLNLI